MTKPDTTSTPTLPLAVRRPRPDSDRALRRMRLAFLIGWSVPEMAALFALSPSTIFRRLQQHDLRRPEAPGERGPADGG